MPDRLSIHEPVLVNTIGHAAGAVLFGYLLYLFLVNRRQARKERSGLPALAAALALVWNIGSMVALATDPGSGIFASAIVGGGFAALSLLPAVLLRIHIESRWRWLWVSGYALSATAIALHVMDLFTGAAQFHFAALLLVTLGFAGLTALSFLLEIKEQNRPAASRLVGAMLLFLLAISLAHFSSQHPNRTWLAEVILHHASLPLAIFVLLQDYRFLLLDAFLRFVINASLAAGALLGAIRVSQSPELARIVEDPFQAGLLFVSVCLLLIGFVYVRNRLQNWLTRAVFLRSDVESPIRELHHLGRTAQSEEEYLKCAMKVVAQFLHASIFELTAGNRPKAGTVATPAVIEEPARLGLPVWVHAIMPMRFSRGDVKWLLLGSRAGGRRYLSEDIAVLRQLGAAVTEYVEQLRNSQMQNLMSQAELKALQAQINPHFLFNSLNTLYGTIHRTNREARRLVVNLADVFRYFLQSERPFISIDEELRITQAYLEIEELRLGARLRTEMNIDPSARHAKVPVLSIQPLVENAIKHGVAARAGEGFVRIAIRRESNWISIIITNSGGSDLERINAADAGIGLSNVRRRLALCYGEETQFEVVVANDTTSVGFTLPLAHSPEFRTAG